MITADFSGPLANELIKYIDQLKVTSSVDKSIFKGLRALDRLTQKIPLPSGTIDEAFTRAWLAPCEKRGSNTLRGRYFLLRRFCRFLATRRPGTFIPDKIFLPPRQPAPSPHIYTRDEIRRLLNGALQLKDWEKWHHCPIRSKTMHAIILLLATTGLRISEAIRLTLKDVDSNQGLLHIRESKFKKSRIVPLSQGTLSVLHRYRNLRITVAPIEPHSAFFVSGRGKAYSPSWIEVMFRQIVIEAGLQPAEGRGPRLHDLRHTFAITRLLLWYREGVNVMARLPKLSTYLGHACVRDTEVYLRATTDLLTAGNHRFHAFVKDLLPEGGES